MRDPDVKNTLNDIEDYTLASVAPFMRYTFSSAVKYGYKEYESPDSYTTYLMFAHEDRVLFYGVDSPKKKFLVPIMGDTEEESLLTLFEPCLFARKGTLTDAELQDIVYSDSDQNIEELEAVTPSDEESDKDFFLRNAMWLLNPMVH